MSEPTDTDIEEIRKNVSSAMRLKLMGNEQLKTNAFRAARETYIEALKLVLIAVDLLKQSIGRHETVLRENIKIAHEMDTVKTEIEEVRIQLISNLSLTEIKLEMWTEALSHSAMVLVVDPTNVKALFRRAVARIRLGEQLEEAVDDLKKLKERDPKNGEIITEISNARSAITERQKRDSEFRTAFRGSLKKDSDRNSGWIHWVGNLVGKDMMNLLAQCGGVGRTKK